MPAPNIIVVMLDDSRRDELDAMPQARQYIGAEQGSGVKFTRAYCPTPLCSPNRASFLRGQYAHNTDVWENPQNGDQGFNGLRPLDDDTLPVWLQAAGYTTGFAGKYINGYAEASASEPASYVPPGWDDWRAFGDGTYAYEGPVEVNQNGNVTTIDSQQYYNTWWVRDRVLARIDDWAESDTPFYIQACFTAPHNDNPEAESQYEGDSNVGAPESNVFNKAKPVNVPWIADNPAYTQGAINDLILSRRQKRDVLRSVDDAVKAIRDKLVSYGILDDTLIWVISDNGFLLGEHRVIKKQKPYEEALGIPCLMRWTNGPLGTGEKSRIISTVDITASIVDAAQATLGYALDGQPVWAPQPPSGQYRPIMIEGLATGETPTWDGVRVHNYQYVEYQNPANTREFYDLTVNPDQGTNRIDDPAYSATIASLATLLDSMRDGAGVDYDITWTPPS